MNKNNGDWLEISDLNIFTDYVRNVVYSNFIDTEAEQDDYNEIDLIKTLTDLSP